MRIWHLFIMGVFMIKNNKGFISISIVYSFFVVFMLLLILIMTTYVSNRVQANIYKNDIKKNEKVSQNVFTNYLEQNIESNGDLNLVYSKGFNAGYRYQGENPDNYVSFNNELWRIIGIIENIDGEKRIKMIRVSPIENIMFDYKSGSDQLFIGSSDSQSGSNDWTDSQLMMLLNPEKYLNSGYSQGAITHEYLIEEGYVIANGKKIFRNMGSYMDNKGVYYPGIVSTYQDYSETLSTEDIHKISPEYDKYISELYWSISSIDNTLIPENFYEQENQISNLPKPELWIGKVGLIYPSDYYLAQKDGNWLSYINDTYTMISHKDTNDKIITIDNTGAFDSSPTNIIKNIYPVIYLNSKVTVTSGNGSIYSPYEVGEGYEED